jgi:hypothetical protein
MVVPSREIFLGKMDSFELPYIFYFFQLGHEVFYTSTVLGLQLPLQITFVSQSV